MPKVICTRPNAAEIISGVNFTKHEDGMLSEEISDEQAAAFCEIPGYAVVDDEGTAAAKAAEKAAAAEREAEELKALTARAVELKIDVKANWKAARLTAEIKRAEEAAGGAGGDKN